MLKVYSWIGLRGMRVCGLARRRLSWLRRGKVDGSQHPGGAAISRLVKKLQEHLRRNYLVAMGGFGNDPRRVVCGRDLGDGGRDGTGRQLRHEVGSGQEIGRVRSMAYDRSRG